MLLDVEFDGAAILLEIGGASFESISINLFGS